MRADDGLAGLVVVARDRVRSRSEGGGRTLASAPGALLGASVALDAVVGGPFVPLSELLQIEPGDVLLLGPKAQAEATLQEGGRRFAVGRPGAKSGRRALRLIDGTVSRNAITIDEWGADDGI